MAELANRRERFGAQPETSDVAGAHYVGLDFEQFRDVVSDLLGIRADAPVEQYKFADSETLTKLANEMYSAIAEAPSGEEKAKSQVAYAISRFGVRL